MPRPLNEGFLEPFRAPLRPGGRNICFQPGKQLRQRYITYITVPRSARLPFGPLCSIYALRAHFVLPFGHDKARRPIYYVGFGPSPKGTERNRRGPKTARALWAYIALPFGDGCKASSASFSESPKGNCYAPLWFGFASRLAGDDGKNQRGVLLNGGQ